MCALGTYQGSLDPGLSFVKVLAVPWACMLRCMASSPWDSVQGFIILLLALGVLADTDTCLFVPDRMFFSFYLLKQTDISPVFSPLRASVLVVSATPEYHRP